MTTVVISQMIMIFLLIAIGFGLSRSSHLTSESSRDLSWIVLNITNPITILVAAIEDEQKVSAMELAVAFALFIGIYIFLGIVAYLLPIVMRVERDDRYSYRYLSVFSNVGFIGIPFCSAVFGVHSLIYVSICSLVFNLIAYTVGMSAMEKVGMRQNGAVKPGEVDSPESLTGGDTGMGGDSTSGESRCSGEGGARKTMAGLKKVVNSGTVFSILTIVVYIMNIKFPSVIMNTLSYIGRSTTFLSMIVLGVSVASLSVKEIFGKPVLYVFTLLRQIVVPVALIFVLKPFVDNKLLLQTAIIMVAMPCANLPLMMAKQYRAKEDTISSGIMLTTFCAILTIPIVTWFF
ncbi:AEC family transporter [Lacrimispora saccharolytica]|uniref:AEC family transporter n=1 Tax=Lacrimispora saccharolytica TaxID=84030 RepID=UPI00265CFE30|nr:AEC family transporter [Lacrimispora saccharolytica]MCF2656531.1 AEC family transporter [Lacrimispora saccharolytica]